ncbi:MAG TPA: PHB depolymerase family esterase, partial [Polyangiaceae bacterium]|nr:PHB depolymerase family esterase [Polyangiaceae bacterium]
PDGASVAPGDAGGPTSYDIDITQTSASGLSSGGFMAVQFHVAYSSIMKGVAVFAGGPFYCAQGSLTNAEVDCQYPTTAPSVTPFVAATNQFAAAGTVDPVANLSHQRVYLFGGADDHTVNPVTMDALRSYYEAFVDPSNIQYESRHAATGHTMPTLEYGVSCDMTESPYIGNCSYDGAGAALAQIYGPLAARATTLGGTFVEVPQTDLVADAASHSLADTGYAYVPAACARGERCRIHVAFHGCLQESSGSVGDQFYRHAGYNEWADTNHIVVLYPQTITSSGNPNACWDWWGYDSSTYATQGGPQMAMVRAMIRRFAGQ